ncbi:MAG: TIGR00297 family protein [Rubrobacteraceae bacterium]
MISVLVVILVPAAFAGLAYRLGMVSRGGALGGFVVAVAIHASLGWRGFAVLALFVVGGSALTRLGYRRKELSGTAEGGGGRRGARNALANAGVAVACALLAALTPYPEAFAAAFIASLGAAFADTAESEVGQVYGHTPRLITTFARVPPGTDGAISLPGTLAGLGAAILTAAFGFWIGLVGSASAVAIVGAAAFLGTVVDSLIGALAPRLGNELTNAACTLTAASLALLA